ncbi:tetratricopeptide repeat protein 22-like [Patiria miniata]|uniref:TIR domain-containing protein n=1 Tax=Patiria miniata TaxID=46514 RepID=A0A914A4M5_PATMI|nr:tetratricopeptide repeat protein 22-like [Patiria miniata]
METGWKDLELSLLERPFLDVTTTVKRKEEMDEVLTKTFEDFMLNLLQIYGLQCVEEKCSEILEKFISGNLQDVQCGSVTFIFRIESREGLDKLWSMYTTGELANKLTKIFITDELTTEDKSDLAIQATILESDYKRACRFFDELEKDKAVPKSYISTQVFPGHFMLPLLINKEINIDTTIVETKLRDLDHFLRVKTGRPEELAILNVKGLLNLRLHRYEEALDCFHAVLAKDPDNLNALANLQYVLEKLFKLAEAGNYREMWHRLLRPVEMATQRDDSIIVKALRKQRRIQARCLAEQAYAHTFDIHSENVSGQRHMQSIELYQKALQLGGDVTDEEQHEWKFCMAINEHKLFTFLPYHNQPDQHDPKVHLEHALKLFSDLVVGGGSVDKEIQWDSWCHLGDIFRTMKQRHMQQNVPHEMRKYTKDPEQCMTKAMEISPDNPRLLVRYANVHYSLNKDRAKSLELLDASLKSDATNWKALSTRATINMKHYNSQQKQDRPELRDILDSAKGDLEKALSMNVTPWDLTQLGQVYYRLAKNHTKEEIAKKSLFQKALVCFSKSVDCPDGNNRTDVHFLRGLCLFDIEEKRAAIGCFKQAIACEAPYHKNTRNFNELLRVYLSILQEENPPKDESILAETAFFLKKALKKYGQYNMSKYCISKFTVEHKKELLLLLGYCRKYGELNELVSLLEKTSFATPRSPLHIHETPRAPFGHGMRSAKISSISHDGRPMLRTLRYEGAGTPQEEVDMQNTGASVTGGPAEEASPTIQEPAEEVKEQPIKEAPKEARVPDFKYDFIVVYPKSERDWVSYDLLNELEAVRNLKGCTRDRAALAGSMKISSEINLMKESASILLVINQDFMSECEASMNYALKLRKDKQRSRVVIPVLRDDSEIPDEIDMLLNPFTAASGPVNWDRLKFSIEQQI